MDKDFQDILNEMIGDITPKNDQQMKSMRDKIKRSRAQRQKLIDQHAELTHKISFLDPSTQNVQIDNIRKEQERVKSQIQALKDADALTRKDMDRRELQIGNLKHKNKIVLHAKSGAISAAGHAATAVGINKVPILHHVVTKVLDRAKSKNNAKLSKVSAGVHEEFDPTQKHPGRGTKECEIKSFKEFLILNK